LSIPESLRKEYLFSPDRINDITQEVYLVIRPQAYSVQLYGVEDNSGTKYLNIVT